MKDLDDLLGSLCVAIKDKKLKSKQAAFNLFLSEIGDAKSLYTLEQICECLNRNTGLSLSNDTYRTMIDRAKRKQSIQKGKPKSIKNPIGVEVAIDKKESVTEKSSIDVDVDPQNLNNYLRVCFNSERIAKRAIEAGVSIEEIKSWKCPNQINLGTKLSNHIQNK